MSWFFRSWWTPLYQRPCGTGTTITMQLRSLEAVLLRLGSEEWIPRVCTREGINCEGQSHCGWFVCVRFGPDLVNGMGKIHVLPPASSLQCHTATLWLLRREPRNKIRALTSQSRKARGWGWWGVLAEAEGKAQIWERGCKRGCKRGCPHLTGEA